MKETRQNNIYLITTTISSHTQTVLYLLYFPVIPLIAIGHLPQQRRTRRGPHAGFYRAPIMHPLTSRNSRLGFVVVVFIFKGMCVWSRCVASACISGSYTLVVED